MNPAENGTYILVLENPQDREIATGKFGYIHYRQGWYLYVGSAFGPGGIQARVNRHFKADKKAHWHIDYLTLALGVKECWYHAGAQRLECAWSRHLESMHDHYPVTGFGSSDCQCASHLHYFSARPSRAALANLLQLTLNTRGS